MLPTLFMTLLLSAWAAVYTTSQGTAASDPKATQVKTAELTSGVPKPAMKPTTGIWKYKDVSPGAAFVDTASLTIKDDGAVWTVTTGWQSDLGPVTDVATYEKGSLILRHEAFDHFLHKDQPWKPVAINLDFTARKVTGIMKYVDRPDKVVARDLHGPVFVVGSPDTLIGCLPLAQGYSTQFRYFEVDRLPVDPQAAEKLMQLEVVGEEHVTVPAGTFDTWKVELSAADGSYKETVWIAKDLRIPVKARDIEVFKKASLTTTTELVQ